MHLKYIALQFLTICIVPCFCINNSETCKVNLSKDGPSYGTLRRTFQNVAYCEYLGVRYAEPPTGERRFKNPEPIHRSKPENLTLVGNVCPQLDHAGNRVGHEDCLFLNVLVPVKRPESGLPVLVFIHGYRGKDGSGGANYGADYLLSTPMVILTFNYRLGPLGFLRNTQHAIDGNFGLKDQRLALQWVQWNIHLFGGDPKRITLMGQGVGADAVTHHMTSTKFSGLFHQAIVLGGSLIRPPFFNFESGSCTKAYLDYLNASSLEALQALDYLTVQFELPEEGVSYEYAGMRWSCFAARMDGDMVDTYPWFLDRPVNRVPMLVVQTGEFGLLKIEKPKFLLEQNYLNAGMEPLIDNISYTVDRWIESKPETDRDRLYRKLINIANAYYPMKRFLNRLVELNFAEEIFYLQFEFDGKFGFGKQVALKDRLIDSTGAVHGDELGYIFDPFNFKEALRNRTVFEKEWQVHGYMATIVGLFVKLGVRFDGLRDFPEVLAHSIMPGVWWPRYNGGESDRKYLNFKDKFEVRTDDDGSDEVFQLWEMIYRCANHNGCDKLREFNKRFQNESEEIIFE